MSQWDGYLEGIVGDSGFNRAMVYYLKEKEVIGQYNGGVKLESHDTEIKDETGKSIKDNVDETAQLVQIVQAAQKKEPLTAAWIEKKWYHLVNTNEEDRFLVYSSDKSRALIFYDTNYFFLFIYEDDGKGTFEGVMGKFNKQLETLLKDFDNREWLNLFVQNHFKSFILFNH